MSKILDQISAALVGGQISVMAFRQAFDNVDVLALAEFYSADEESILRVMEAADEVGYTLPTEPEPEALGDSPLAELVNATTETATVTQVQ